MVNTLLFSLFLVVPILILTKNPLIFRRSLFFLVFTYFWTENPLILQRRHFFLVFTYFWYEKGCHREIQPRVPPFLATPLFKRFQRRPGPPRGGAGGTMTPGPMEFGGPMSSKEAHRNFGEDLFFWRSPNFDQKNS